MSDIMQIYGMEFKDVEWDIHKIWNQRNTCLFIVFAQNYQQTLKTENVYQPLTMLFCNWGKDLTLSVLFYKPASANKSINQ